MSYIGKQPTKAPLTASDIEDGIITAAKIEDGAVVAAEIASNAVTTAKINADAVTGAKIADDAINSEHYTDGSIDTAHIAADQIVASLIADDAINSEHYTDGSVDTAHIADLNVTQAKIADQAINEAKMQVSNSPTNGYFLSAQSGNTGGMTWAEAGGGGKILQVLQGSHGSQASMSATSFVDVSTNTNVSLTCASTSSKVFIIANFHELYLNGSHGVKVRVTAGGSQIMRGSNLLITGSSGEKVISQPLIFLHSPNSTSAIEYKMQFASSDGTEVRVNQHSTVSATLTLMEVGA